jgi:leucyl aminopeptidase
VPLSTGVSQCRWQRWRRGSGTRLAAATSSARDLINTPANDEGPAELADAAADLATRFGASIIIIIGAACTLGLAQILMQLDAPVQLRALIPAVENSVDGHSYRPSDVLRSGKS